jgi:hypothetical protein
MQQPQAESKPLANGKSHDIAPVLDTLPEESRVQANGVKKESPYDHLPAEKDLQEAVEPINASAPDPSSGPTSPVGSVGKISPDPVNGSSDLDYIPRSSPTVQIRSITPEHAQHLRKLTEKEGPVRVSASLRGRKSPPGKVANRAHTLNSIATMRSTKPAVPSDVVEDDSLYNVPRPSADGNGLYSVPKASPNSSPPSPRGRVAPTSSAESDSVYSVPKSNGDDDNLYSAPKPVDATNGDVSNDVSEEAVYKVPNSVPSTEEGGVSKDDPSLYNVPRSFSDDMMDNAAYNDVQTILQPIAGDDDSFYNTPRPVEPGAPLSPSNLKDNYESIDGNSPTFNTLRPARSFESLNKLRVNQTEGLKRTMTAYASSPSTKAPVCEYVDIDIANRPPALAPAKNAPLPPLPTPGGPDPIVDNVYAEITEETIARSRQMSLSSQNPAHALYNELPPARAKYPDSVMAQEGMAKAQELAEEEGYELFLPAGSGIRAGLRDGGARVETSGTYPPVSTASALLQKYNIHIHESGARSRPFSESDILEDSHRAAKHGASESDDLQSDEYVIVTGPDRRPKLNIGAPQALPILEDQYESMNSAHATLPNHESHYSTPNPTLWVGSGESCVPQPQLSGPEIGMTRQSSMGKVPPTQSSDAPSLPPRKCSDSDCADIDLENMSPVDPNSAPLYSNFHHHGRQPSNLSEGEEDISTLPDKGPLSVPIACESSVVKIMAGSPMDGVQATEIK